MNMIRDYCSRKGMDIWTDSGNDIEAVKGPIYLNVIKQEKNFLVIMSIRGGPQWMTKEFNDMENIDKDFHNMFIETKRKKLNKTKYFDRFWYDFDEDTGYASIKPSR